MREVKKSAVDANANRLIGIMERRGERTLSSIALTKDGVGRIREATRDVPLEPASLQGKRPLSFDDSDRIAGAGYDKMGRLTAGEGRSFQWDLASRLTSYRGGQSRVTFTYDGFGNRLTRTQGGRTRSMVWNYALGLPSVSVLQDEGTATRYYVHTPGGSLLYSVEAAGSMRNFYHYNEMGSTLFLSDDGGKVTDSYAYGTYGRITDSTGTADNPFTFVGQFGVMREPATGLYYMRARYYDSATGRFLSPDPLGEDLTEAKSLNLYQYASQNPVRFIDPSGLDDSAELFRARLQFVVSGTLLHKRQTGPLRSLQARLEFAVIGGLLLSGDTNFRQLPASVAEFFQDEEDNEFLRRRDESGLFGFPSRLPNRKPLSLRDKNIVDPFARPDRSGIDEVIL